MEGHGDQDGRLAEVFSGEQEDDKRKLAKALLDSRRRRVKAQLKEIGKDPDYAEERAVLTEYGELLDRQADTTTKIKAAQEALEEKLDQKYAALTEDEVTTLVVDDKWLTTLAAAVQGELDRVLQTLNGRILQLAERYATPLPQITGEVDALAARVEGHLKKMGAVWM